MEKNLIGLLTIPFILLLITGCTEEYQKLQIPTTTTTTISTTIPTITTTTLSTTSTTSPTTTTTIPKTTQEGNRQEISVSTKEELFEAIRKAINDHLNK